MGPLGRWRFLSRKGMWCADGVLSHYVVWVSRIMVGGKSWPWLAGSKFC